MIKNLPINLLSSIQKELLERLQCIEYLSADYFEYADKISGKKAAEQLKQIQSVLFMCNETAAGKLTDRLSLSMDEGLIEQTTADSTQQCYINFSEALLLLKYYIYNLPLAANSDSLINHAQYLLSVGSDSCAERDFLAPVCASTREVLVIRLKKEAALLKKNFERLLFENKLKPKLFLAAQKLLKLDFKLIYDTFHMLGSPLELKIVDEINYLLSDKKIAQKDFVSLFSKQLILLDDVLKKSLKTICSVPVNPQLDTPSSLSKSMLLFSAHKNITSILTQYFRKIRYQINPSINPSASDESLLDFNVIAHQIYQIQSLGLILEKPVLADSLTETGLICQFLATNPPGLNTSDVACKFSELLVWYELLIPAILQVNETDFAYFDTLNKAHENLKKLIGFDKELVVNNKKNNSQPPESLLDNNVIKYSEFVVANPQMVSTNLYQERQQESQLDCAENNKNSLVSNVSVKPIDSGIIDQLARHPALGDEPRLEDEPREKAKQKTRDGIKSAQKPAKSPTVSAPPEEAKVSVGLGAKATPKTDTDTIDALVVKLGCYTYAVPISSIQGVARIPANLYKQSTDDKPPRYQYKNIDYQVENLVNYIDIAATIDVETQGAPVLLTCIDDIPVAFIISSFDKYQKIVIRSVNKAFDALPGIAGAAILNTGVAVPVLDITVTGRSLLTPLNNEPNNKSAD